MRNEKDISFLISHFSFLSSTIPTMKIAILSDIHGNLPALLAVAEQIESWQPDRVIVAGDTVNRGPESLACWQFVTEKAATQGWQLLKGNHEEYVISRGQPDNPREGPDFELNRVAYWTYQQLNGQVAALTRLPDGYSEVVDGRELRIRHASMQHNRDGIYPEAADTVIETQIAPPPAVFVTAHTHRPFARQVNGTLVVNTGSVGTPADGDGRASYAQMVWQHGRWQAQIQRVPYDYEQTQQAYFQSAILDQAGAITWLIYYEWQLACYLFPQWMTRCWPLVVAGEVDVETAVTQYLHQVGLPIPDFKK
jgi:putative phosphoesterase